MSITSATPRGNARSLPATVPRYRVFLQVHDTRVMITRFTHYFNVRVHRGKLCARPALPSLGEEMLDTQFTLLALLDAPKSASTRKQAEAPCKWEVPNISLENLNDADEHICWDYRVVARYQECLVRRQHGRLCSPTDERPAAKASHMIGLLSHELETSVSLAGCSRRALSRATAAIRLWHSREIATAPPTQCPAHSP